MTARQRHDPDATRRLQLAAHLRPEGQFVSTGLVQVVNDQQRGGRPPDHLRHRLNRLGPGLTSTLAGKKLSECRRHTSTRPDRPVRIIRIPIESGSFRFNPSGCE